METLDINLGDDASLLNMFGNPKAAIGMLTRVHSDLRKRFINPETSGVEENDAASVVPSVVQVIDASVLAPSASLPACFSGLRAGDTIVAWPLFSSSGATLWTGTVVSKSGRSISVVKKLGQPAIDIAVDGFTCELAPVSTAKNGAPPPVLANATSTTTSTPFAVGVIAVGAATSPPKKEKETTPTPFSLGVIAVGAATSPPKKEKENRPYPASPSTPWTFTVPPGIQKAAPSDTAAFKFAKEPPALGDAAKASVFSFGLPTPPSAVYPPPASPPASSPA